MNWGFSRSFFMDFREKEMRVLALGYEKEKARKPRRPNRWFCTANGTFRTRQVGASRLMRFSSFIINPQGERTKNDPLIALPSAQEIEIGLRQLGCAAHQSRLTQ